MKLVKIPAYQQQAKSDDELKSLTRMKELGIEPEPETEEEKRAKWTKTHFYINPEAVSLCLPGQHYPESETAIWMLDGEAFMATIPIDDVVRLLDGTTESAIEQYRKMERTFERMKEDFEADQTAKANGEQSFVDQWNERIENAAYPNVKFVDAKS